VERFGPQRVKDACERLRWCGPSDDREARVAAAFASGVIECRDGATGQVLSSAKLSPGIKCLEVLGDGLLAVAADGSSGIVEKWCGSEAPSTVLPEGKGCQNGEVDAEQNMRQFSLPGPVAGAHLDPCRADRLAFGGGESDVKVWNLERGEVSWRAKNVRENSLCLRVPVCVANLQWATQLAPSRSLLLCGTTDGKIRLYDVGMQRRPLFELKIGVVSGQGSCGYTGTADEVARPVTCSLVAPTRGDSGAWSFFVGNTMGMLREFDLRNLSTCQAAQIPPGRKSHTLWAAKQLPFRRGYRNIMGSVRSLDVHCSGEAVVAVGLGRFAYVFNTSKRSRIGPTSKVYLKQKLCSVLFSSEAATASKEENDAESGEESDVTGCREGSDGGAAEGDEVQEGFSSDEEAKEDAPDDAGGNEASSVAAGAKKKRRKRKLAPDIAFEGEGSADAADQAAADSAAVVEGTARKKRRAGKAAAAAPKMRKSARPRARRRANASAAE